MSTMRGLLDRLRGRFGEEGVPFVVGGSVALAARGVVRATQDLDLMVMVKDLTPVHRAMTAAGMEWVNEVTFRDEGTGLFLDIIVVADEAQRYAFEAATLEPIDGVDGIRVLTSGSCCVMLLREATKGDPKRRPLRLRDIEALSLVVGLDWDEIRSWAERMGYGAAYRDLRIDGKPPPP